VPDKFKDDKFLQLVLSKLDYEKKRADKAEEREKQLVEQRKELVDERNEWKSLYLSERDRSTKLEFANVELAKANSEFKIANETMKNQINLDKQYITSLESENRKLKLQRYVFFGVGLVFGGTGGYVAGKL
jgi:hypothetical protein